jgi:hypothetical protein
MFLEGCDKLPKKRCGDQPVIHLNFADKLNWSSPVFTGVCVQNYAVTCRFIPPRAILGLSLRHVQNHLLLANTQAAKQENHPARHAAHYAKESRKCEIQRCFSVDKIRANGRRQVNYLITCIFT